MPINVTPIPRLTVLTTPAFTWAAGNTGGAATTAVSSNSAIAFPAASQAEMEAAASLIVGATPGGTKYHPGVAKAWLFYNGATPADMKSHGISGVVENSVGNYTVSFSTDFTSVNYCAVLYSKQNDVTNANPVSTMPALAVGSYQQAFTIDGTNYRDQNPLCLVFYGEIE
jgi:hypothetical protein